ncbi:MAG: nucleotidyltransferase domain-containing protein [Candidatus Cloacimonadales bacterium]|nr:nucleotidyltransferase domain-containing protein [Candidatus Cloacimonadales bacterium]
MVSVEIIIGKERLHEFCRTNNIRKLSLFGSALRDELKPNSDIDLLVEFDVDHIPGLLKLAALEIQLSEFLGRKVDLRTPAELSKYFRDDVISIARELYVA